MGFLGRKLGFWVENWGFWRFLGDFGSKNGVFGRFGGRKMGFLSDFEWENGLL
jgi:hypothetical protein